MRILYLSHYFPSGQMTHVFSLARAIRRQGHAVHIANEKVHTREQVNYIRTLAGGLPFSTNLTLQQLRRLVLR